MSQSVLIAPTRQINLALVARVGAATALLGAAVVHSTVIGPHYSEWPLAGVFFTMLQIVETLLALAVIGAWSRITALAVVSTSLATVAVWVVSRTIGIPIGPEAFQPEAMGTADIACCALELVAAALVLPWAAKSGSRQRAVVRNGGGVPTVAAMALVAVVTISIAAVGLRAALGDEGHAEDGHGEHASSVAPAQDAH
jgi:hypothetical protein